MKIDDENAWDNDGLNDEIQMVYMRKHFCSHPMNGYPMEFLDSKRVFLILMS